MKKALSLLLGILLSCSVFAQPKINVGVTASGGLGHFALPEASNGDLHLFSSAVYQTGILVETALNEKFSIRLAGTYINNGSSNDISFRFPNGDESTNTVHDQLIANTIDLGLRYTWTLKGVRLLPGAGISFGSAYQIKNEYPDFNSKSTWGIKDPRFNYLSTYLECLAQFDLSKEVALNAGLAGNIGLTNLNDALTISAPNNIQLKVEVLYHLN